MLHELYTREPSKARQQEIATFDGRLRNHDASANGLLLALAFLLFGYEVLDDHGPHCKGVRVASPPNPYQDQRTLVEAGVPARTDELANVEHRALSNVVPVFGHVLEFDLAHFLERRRERGEDFVHHSVDRERFHNVLECTLLQVLQPKL